MSSGSDGGGFGGGFSDVFEGLSKIGELAIDYKRAKNLDVETNADGNNMPGREDLLEHQGSVTGDLLGGTFKKSFGGFTIPQWGIVVLTVGATGLIIKKIGVF